MRRAEIILIKVKSCNASLHMLLLCIRSYLKSVMRYKFLILDTCHQHTLHLRDKDVRFRDYVSKPKWVREKKKFWKHCSSAFSGSIKVGEFLDQLADS